LSASREARWKAFADRGPQADKQADSFKNFALVAQRTLWNAVCAAEVRLVSQCSDGRARSSPTCEQFVDEFTAKVLIDATNSRTRRSQRVLHEERNARQRDAAGRKPHRHH
jgi:hypothetical protein